LERREVAERQANEALEKLNRGIQESKQMVQQQTMKLAQEFFGDSVGELKEQIQQSRATLEDLPQQIPGGDDESFQMLFQELMDNYEKIEGCLAEAEQNVSELDTESLIKQGEVEATDAARRQAQELGLDLTEIEGTGTDGRITVDDVKKAAESAQGEAEEAAEEAIRASDAARRKAEELGVDLSEIEGSGSGGLITVKDVTSLAEETAEGATDAVEQAAGGATETAGKAVDGATGAVGQAADTAGQAAEDAAGKAGEAAEGAGEAAEDGEVKATNAARRKAEELGVDLSQIEGSGAGGLITIRDVVKA
jgi:pyruvate/2-oxoglutarate dehydrogenase complex dihydrolipoamide acyltransferase (E2) component